MRYMEMKYSIGSGVIFIGLLLVVFLTGHFHTGYLSTFEYLIFVCLWLLEISFSFFVVEDSRLILNNVFWYFLFAVAAGGYICFQ